MIKFKKLAIRSMFTLSVALLCIFASNNLVAIEDIALTAEQRTAEAATVLNFSKESYRQRYNALVDELRCPKCQNQNLADSNAPIALDLKYELQRLLEEGNTDKEILNFMTLRYGNFVLYQPPLNAATSFLWLIPIAVVLIGLAIWVGLLRRFSSDTAEVQDSKTNSIRNRSQAIDQLSKRLSDRDE